MHRVDIAYFKQPCLHHLHRRHRSVVRYQINIVSTSLNIVDIAMSNQYRVDNIYIKYSCLLPWHYSIASLKLRSHLKNIYLYIFFKNSFLSEINKIFKCLQNVLTLTSHLKSNILVICIFSMINVWYYFFTS